MHSNGFYVCKERNLTQNILVDIEIKFVENLNTVRLNYRIYIIYFIFYFVQLLYNQNFDRA